MKSIGVECRFAEDGSVRVRKVQVNGRWQSVGQGRQWHDENGRHILIMLPNEAVGELLLQTQTLTWQLVASRGRDRGETAV